MIKFKYIAILAAAVGLAGCSAQDEFVKEEEQKPSEPTARTFTLRASMPASETRVLADADWNLTWQAGDAIALVENTGVSYTFQLKEGFEGETDAEFECNESVPESFTPKYAIYPASIYRGYDKSGETEGELKVRLDNFYTDIEEGVIRCPMIGEVSSLADVTDSENATADVSMKHLCGGISFEFENLPESVKEIHLVSVSNFFAGDYVVNYTDDGYTIGNNGGSGNDVYLELPSQNRPSRIYFPLPVGDYRGFTLYANDGNGTKTVELWSDVNTFKIERSGVACYPKITLSDDILAEFASEEIKHFAENGGTYTLPKDVTIGPFTVSNNFTLDLNGHTLTIDGYDKNNASISVVDKATFTINNRSSTKEGLITANEPTSDSYSSEASFINVGSEANFSMISYNKKNVVLTTNSKQKYGIRMSEGGDVQSDSSESIVYIQDATINARGDIGIYIPAGDRSSRNLTIENGSQTFISAKKNAICAKGNPYDMKCNIFIWDGTFQVDEYKKDDPNNYEVIASPTEKDSKKFIEFNGGTFKNFNPCALPSSVLRGSGLVVTDGDGQATTDDENLKDKTYQNAVGKDNTNPPTYYYTVIPCNSNNKAIDVQ